MQLIIVHNHFRPGGVRRVIELATPHLVAQGRERIDAVILAAGEAPPADWLRAFRRRLAGTPVRLALFPAFAYASESGLDGRSLRHKIRASVSALLQPLAGKRGLVWAHNPGLGRNLRLARELALACDAHRIPLVAHHHDWWFENRWRHFAAMRRSGFRTLPAVAKAVFPESPHVAHVAINRADAAVLEHHFAGLAGWLPNPAEPEPPPPPRRVAATRAWLRRRAETGGPVWLLPCRLLRRKNIAEALLLTRWLRPEATLVTTAGVSSAEEQGYADTLAAAAKAHGWPLRLAVLHGGGPRAPGVADLLAGCEVVLLTSLQEGFGLPVLEASAARRPLITRRLPNVSADLAAFGFVFPQSYREVWVAPGLFDWGKEHERQHRLLVAWRSLMPRSARQWLGRPQVLAAGRRATPVPFSRLTITAQLEVLAHPIERSWAECAPLNPFLATWRARAAQGRLQITPWPRTAARWLDGRAYARRFHALTPRSPAPAPRPGAARATQAEFLRGKLRADHLYPLLWSSTP